MNLYLFDEDVIVRFKLPIKKIGDFWMTDNDGKNIVNICGEDNEWVLSESDISTITFARPGDDKLKENSYYLVEKNGKKYVLFSTPVNDNSFDVYQFPSGGSVKVGKNPSNEVSINLPYFNDVHYTISEENGKWKMTKAPKSAVYVNNEKVKEETCYLKNGDVINCFGFKLILAKDTIFVNSPFSRALLINNLIKKDVVVRDEITDEEIINEDLYGDNDYFLRSPRMRKKLEPLEMRIDSPPAKENMQETPLIMTLAPMITMAASSLVTLISTIQAVTEGQRTWKQAIPALVITGTMIISMFVWPFIAKAYEKRQKKKREENRQEKYRSYVNIKKNEIINSYDEQKKIMEDSYLALNVC